MDLALNIPQKVDILLNKENKANAINFLVVLWFIVFLLVFYTIIKFLVTIPIQ